MKNVEDRKGPVSQTLDIYIASDQPETCRKCGSRTEFVESLHGNQLHWCMDPKCDYEYLVQPDDEDDG